MAAESITKLTLRSKVDSTFTIEVDDRVINSCSILKNVTEHTDNSEAVEVDMTPKQLEKFVEFLNHFETPDAPKDSEWTNAFFRQFSDDEFKELCWKADYLDSERFLTAASDYTLVKIDEMTVAEVQKFLNIVDDFTPEERRAAEDSWLEFFSNVKFEDQPQDQEDDQ